MTRARPSVFPALALVVFIAGAARPQEAPAGGTTVRGIDTVQAIDVGGLEARAAALMLSGEEGGNLEAAVLAAPLGSGSQGVRVVLVIDIARSGVPATGAPGDGAQRTVTEIYAYALDADGGVAAHLTQAFATKGGGDRGVKFLGHLDLEPGEYSLRALVRRRQGDRWSLRVVPLEVLRADDAAALPPLFLEDAEPWILALEASPRHGEAGDDEPVFPMLMDGRPRVPATRPPDEDAPAGGVDTASRGAAAVRPSQLMARYREALLLLARRDPAAARAKMIELESAALAAGATDDLAEEALRFARRLARRCSDCLVPLLRLHEELYREHHRRRRFGLATHARQMVAGLTEVYAGASGSPESRDLIASALVSLAGYLQEIGAKAAAETLYRAALRHDDTHEGALLGLALIHEAFGAYPDAIGLLRRLLELHPGNDEARLRLAVCLHRRGLDREAETLLRECLADGGEEWVRAVAYQELAGLFAEDERVDEAAGLLREALGHHPSLQRLHIQLAAVYDRLGRAADVRATLAQLDPRAGREAASPRLIYSQGSTGAIEASRRRLAAASDERLEALVEALTKGARSGG